MRKKEHPDNWKKDITKKLNEQGWRFNVKRDWDGKVEEIDCDPLDDYEYSPITRQWHPTKDGSEKDNDFSFDGNQIASHLSFGAKVTEDEKKQWLEEWIEAMNENDDSNKD